MFCRKCGKEIPADSDFCPNCGAKASWTGSTESISPEEAAKRVAERRKEKTLVTATVIAGVLVVVAAIVITIIITTSPTTIDLNDYVTVTFKGTNGYGFYHVDFDDEKFDKDYGDKIKMTESDEFWFSSVSATFWERLVYWDIESSGSDGSLKNGDTFKLVWYCDDERAESVYGVKIKRTDISVTVTGLK